MDQMQLCPRFCLIRTRGCQVTWVALEHTGEETKSSVLIDTRRNQSHRDSGVTVMGFGDVGSPRALSQSNVEHRRVRGGRQEPAEQRESQEMVVTAIWRRFGEKEGGEDFFFFKDKLNLTIFLSIRHIHLAYLPTAFLRTLLRPTGPESHDLILPQVRWPVNQWPCAV